MYGSKKFHHFTFFSTYMIYSKFPTIDSYMYQFQLLHTTLIVCVACSWRGYSLYNVHPSLIYFFKIPHIHRHLFRNEQVPVLILLKCKKFNIFYPFYFVGVQMENEYISDVRPVAISQHISLFKTNFIIYI
jgi:hypothetical protein